MTFIGSMRRNVCAAAALVATAIVAHADDGNDYPAAASVFPRFTYGLT